MVILAIEVLDVERVAGHSIDWRNGWMANCVLPNPIQADEGHTSVGLGRSPVDGG